MQRVAVLVALVIAAAAGDARGGHPGANGLIAYTPRAGTPSLGIWVVQPDGTGKRRLVDGAEPAWSPDGTRIAFNRGNEIYVANADGSGARRVEEGVSPSWSPDGRKLVYAARFDPVRIWDIWVVELETGVARALTDSPGGEARPVWSPDGQRIAFLREGEVWLMRADGSDPRRVLGGRVLSLDWSPDGQRLVFERDSAIFTIQADGTDERRISPPDVAATGPAWSPDGRRIAFDAFGDLCVMNADGTDARRLTYDNEGESYGAGLAGIDWQPAVGAELGGAARYSCERRDWDLAVSIDANRRTARVGDEIVYSVRATNVGEQPVFRVFSALGVIVSDLGAAGSATTTRGNCQERIAYNAFHCRLDTIFPGETVVVTATARATEPGRLTTRADLGQHGNPKDYNPANDRAEATTMVAGCTIVGTNGRDVLRGTPRRDVICAGEGDDVVLAGAGNDVVYGQGGKDVLHGGPGLDRLDGGRGEDTVAGDAGADVLHGGDGNDAVEGGEGADRVHGGMPAGRVIDGGPPYWNERDKVRGGPGNDVVEGGVGGDELRGDEGNDVLLARDDMKEIGRCGVGRDRLVADRRDVALRSCETVLRRD